jgi:hypothetical protein
MAGVEFPVVVREESDDRSDDGSEDMVEVVPDCAF